MVSQTVQSIDKMSEINFYLWTRNNANASQRIDFDTIQGSNFDVTRETKVFVHGFLSKGRKDYILDMKDVILKKCKKTWHIYFLPGR